MSKETVIIKTQYYENYNVNAEGFNLEGDGKPYWKPKGGHEFTIKADADTIFYTYDSDLKEVLSKMVADESDFMNKYEYIDHEVIFHNPTELSYDLLMKEIDMEEQKQEV